MASSRYYIFTSRFRLVRSRKGEVKSRGRISGFIPHTQMRYTFVIKDFQEVVGSFNRLRPVTETRSLHARLASNCGRRVGGKGNSCWKTLGHCVLARTIKSATSGKDMKLWIKKRKERMKIGSTDWEQKMCNWIRCIWILKPFYEMVLVWKRTKMLDRAARM